MAILIQTSAVPFLKRVTLKNLKLVTSSSFSPFVVLFNMIFDFSVLISTPYAPAL
ncbi:hypothetical protein DPMN_054314 [Dreissena polymorpha]|uniref:Uncharacterized protein n=1 Tax=Dreissena polymorpha TaxID=45954 RepID=A0A9D4CQB9_DREPO|nr:hypothetical protein DPMN_054314 [Dreissena polymorpha]